MRKLTFSTRSVKCILWDLDGTLVSTGGAGVRALDRAFLELYGIAETMKSVNPAGKTDPAIIREIFQQAVGRECRPDEMVSVQEKYLGYLPQECASAADYQIMPGIPEVLDELAEMGMVSGLGTGNLEKGARIKLDRADLNRRLPFGGYGSDSENRPELLKAARMKAEVHAGRSFSPERVFVIGDTERDILAAQAAGFRSVAVATGSSSVQELSRFNPDYALESLKNPSDLLEMICEN